MAETTLRLECMWCQRRVDVVVDDAAYLRWQAGELIQRAMPSLSAEQREMLVSGTCPTCWNKYVGDASDYEVLPREKDDEGGEHVDDSAQ